MDETLSRIANGELIVRVLPGRVSDTNPKLYCLIRKVEKGSFWMINESSFLPRVVDRAAMHLEFLSADVNVPYI